MVAFVSKTVTIFFFFQTGSVANFRWPHGVLPAVDDRDHGLCRWRGVEVIDAIPTSAGDDDVIKRTVPGVSRYRRYTETRQQSVSENAQVFDPGTERVLD